MLRKFTLFIAALLIGTGSLMATDVVTSISNLTEWKAFVKSINDGADYSSTTVTLNADVIVEQDYSYVGECIAGNKKAYPFNGTFDGNGFTLTFNKDNTLTNENLAPFMYADGATIKNLKIAGSLKSSARYMGGIVGNAKGNVTIENCASSITLECSYTDNDAGMGGIISNSEDEATNVTIKNCIFFGKLIGEKGICGIAGYLRGGSHTITNVLNAGAIEYNTNASLANIYRTGGSVSMTKGYYINKVSTASDGTQVSTAKLLNGELANELANADDTGNTLFWGQGNLNKSNVEAYPTLTTETAKKVVRVNISGMYTTPYVNPGGAVPNPCRFGIVGFKLSTSDANTLQSMPAEGGSFVYGTTNLVTTNGMYCITLPAAATTLILPFDCTTLPDGITAYDVTYSSGDNVTATKVNKITANKPVLINGTAGTLYKFSGDATFGGTYEGTLTNGVKAHTNGALTGVYVDANASSGYNPIAYVPADSYVLQNGADGLGFYKVAADNTIRITSFRAYLTAATGGAPSLSIAFTDEETGIQEATCETEAGNSESYNLAGQRVGKNYKGLVVKNGKKYIVK